MIKVKLLKPFRHLQETLSRIGIPNMKERKLYPSLVALPVGEFDLDTKEAYIAHFKEMLKRDEHNITSEDLIRRDNIIRMLVLWGFLEVDKMLLVPPDKSVRFKIIKHHEKVDWCIINKYSLSEGKYERINN